MKLPDLLKHYDHVLRDFKAVRNGTTFQHLRWMIDEMQDMSGAKVMRWLGFVQGALWTQGVFTIDEMRRHNTGLEEADETLAPPKSADVTIIDYLVKKNALNTRGEGRRLIAQGAVKVNEETVDNFYRPLYVGDVIVIGIGRVTFTVTDDDAP